MLRSACLLLQSLLVVLLLLGAFAPCAGQTTASNWLRDSLVLPPANVELKTDKYRFEVPKGTAALGKDQKLRTIKTRFTYTLQYAQINSAVEFGSRILHLDYDTLLLGNFDYREVSEMRFKRADIDGTILFSNCRITTYSLSLNGDTLQCTLFDNADEALLVFDTYYFRVTPSRFMGMQLFCSDILKLPESTKIEVVNRGDFYERVFVGIPDTD